MYYVYALFNKEHNKLYIGQTENIEQRLELHNNNTFNSSFTSRFDGVWISIYEEKCKNRHDALKREKQLKSYQGRLFIKKFIPL